MKFPSKEIINSLKQSRDYSSRISKLLRPGNILVLNGELGSGKTTIVSYICACFGIEDVTSPSFSIVNEYEGKDLLKVYHFDFYRIHKVEELYDLGFEDYLNDESALIFIEWGNLFPEIIPAGHYEIMITVKDPDSREFKLIKNL